MTGNSTADAAREAARTANGQFGEQSCTASELILEARTTPTRVQWTPEAEARGEFASVWIAENTNPWLEVDGQPVDLAGMDLTIDGECGVCSGGGVAGVLLAIDSNDGIQRCDECLVFDGDLEAANHVAQLLSHRTGSAYTVWFESEPKTDSPDPE